MYTFWIGLSVVIFGPKLRASDRHHLRRVARADLSISPSTHTSAAQTSRETPLLRDLAPGPALLQHPGPALLRQPEEDFLLHTTNFRSCVAHVINPISQDVPVLIYQAT